MPGITPTALYACAQSLKLLQAEAYAGIFGDDDVARSARSLFMGRGVIEGPGTIGV